MRYGVERLATRPVSRLLKALADETRLRMVALLAQGELCVCHLERALSLSQPGASRHLAILRAAGVVETRRAGAWVHYRLARQDDPARRALVQALVRGFDAAELARDVARLRAAVPTASCDS